MLTTLDGVQYTFNGMGEGTLIEIAKPNVANVTIQGRMAQPTTPVATSFQVKGIKKLHFL